MKSGLRGREEKGASGVRRPRSCFSGANSIEGGDPKDHLTGVANESPNKKIM